MAILRVVAKLFLAFVLLIGLFIGSLFLYEAYDTRHHVGPDVLSLTSIRLDREPVIFSPREPLVARGGYAFEFCLAKPADAPPPVQVILTRDTGERDSLIARVWQPYGGDVDPTLAYVCTDGRPFAGRRYIKAELTAPTPVVVHQIRWWSGERRMFF